MDEHSAVHEESWWLACIGKAIIWARLRVYESGIAEIFDCDGQTLVYDGEDTARAQLMDAEFRSLDGIDEDDAALFGVALEQIKPPQGKHDADLVRQMIVGLKEPQ